MIENSLKSKRLKRSAEIRKKMQVIKTEAKRSVDENANKLQIKQEKLSPEKSEAKEIATSQPFFEIATSKPFKLERTRWTLAELTEQAINHALSAFNPGKHQLKFFRHTNPNAVLLPNPIYADITPRVSKKPLTFPLVSSTEAIYALSAFGRSQQKQTQLSKENRSLSDETFSCIPSKIIKKEGPNISDEKLMLHTSFQSLCSKSPCRLGCVCKSISEVKSKRTHCGKPRCIFGCTCETKKQETQIREVRKQPRNTKLPERYKDTVISWGGARDCFVESDRKDTVHTAKRRKLNIIEPTSSLTARYSHTTAGGKNVGSAKPSNHSIRPSSKFGEGRKHLSDSRNGSVVAEIRNSGGCQRTNPKNWRKKLIASHTQRPKHAVVSVSSSESESSDEETPFFQHAGGFQKLTGHLETQGVNSNDQSSEEKQYKIRIAKGIIEKLKSSSSCKEGLPTNPDDFATSLRRLSQKVKQLASKLQPKGSVENVRDTNNPSLSAVTLPSQPPQTTKILPEVVTIKEELNDNLSSVNIPSGIAPMLMRAVLSQAKEGNVKVPVVIPTVPIYPVGTIQKAATQGDVQFGFYGMPGVTSHLLLGPLKTTPTGLQVMTGISYNTVAIKDSTNSKISRWIKPTSSMAFVPVKRRGPHQPQVSASTDQNNLSSLPFTAVSLCSVPRVNNTGNQISPSQASQEDLNDSDADSVKKVVESLLQKVELANNVNSAVSSPNQQVTQQMNQIAPTANNKQINFVNINNKIKVNAVGQARTHLFTPLVPVGPPRPVFRLSDNQQNRTPSQSWAVHAAPKSISMQNSANLNYTASPQNSNRVRASAPQAVQVLRPVQSSLQENVPKIVIRRFGQTQQEKKPAQRKVICADSAGIERTLNTMIRTEASQLSSRENNSLSVSVSQKRRRIEREMFIQLVEAMQVPVARYATKEIIVKQAVSVINELNSKNTRLQNCRQRMLQRRAKLFDAYKTMLPEADPISRQECNRNLSSGLQDCYRRRIVKAREAAAKPQMSVQLKSPDFNTSGSEDESVTSSVTSSVMAEASNVPFPVSLVVLPNAEEPVAFNGQPMEITDSEVEVIISDNIARQSEDISDESETITDGFQILSYPEEQDVGVQIHISDTSDVEPEDFMGYSMEVGTSDDTDDNPCPMILECNTISEEIFEGLTT